MNKKLCITDSDDEWKYINVAWKAMIKTKGEDWHKQFGKKYNGQFILNSQTHLFYFRFNSVEDYTLFLLEWS